MKVYQESTIGVYPVYKPYYFILKPYFFRTLSTEATITPVTSQLPYTNKLIFDTSQEIMLLLFYDLPK